MLQGDDIPVLLNKTQNKYDYYINKYDELVKSNQSEYCNNASIAKMVDTQDQKAVNPELSINSDFDLGITHSTSNFKYKINNVKEIISSEDEEEYNLILKAAYNCLKDNEKKGIKTNKFDNALLKSIKISEKSIEIEEYKNKMIHDHFIKSDAYAGYIFPLKKLIGLFNK